MAALKQMRTAGFTIVELLIVVVVIAILAAITIVSYNGIQERANNTAIIDAAGKSSRLIQAYIAKNGTYPHLVDGEFVCITTDSSCRRNSGPMGVNTTFTAELETIGSVPKSVPLASSIRGGITYNYNAARMVNGASAPVVLSYYLKGINTNCGLPALNSETTTAVTSSTGYTSGNIGSSGVTQCVVSVTGPGV